MFASINLIPRLQNETSFTETFIFLTAIVYYWTTIDGGV